MTAPNARNLWFSFCLGNFNSVPRVSLMYFVKHMLICVVLKQGILWLLQQSRSSFCATEVPSTRRQWNLKAAFSLWKCIKCFASTIGQRNIKTQQSSFLNSTSLKSVSEKLRFRDVLVWTVGLKVEVKCVFKFLRCSMTRSKIFSTLLRSGYSLLFVKTWHRTQLNVPGQGSNPGLLKRSQAPAITTRPPFSKVKALIAIKTKQDKTRQDKIYFTQLSFTGH